jgi:hypothetical protein
MAYRDEVLADSPLAYLRLGESSGTTAADEQATHAGTYTNTPTLAVAGAVSGNTAVSFDATQSERVDWTTLGTLGQNIVTSTWEFWINTTYTGQGVILGTFNTGTSLAIQFQLNRSQADAVAAGKTRIFVRGTNGNQLYGEISTNIYDGQWHHIKVTFPTTTTIQVRVDKVDQTITYGLQQAIASTANFGFAMALAARNLRGVIDNFSTITLDEVAVYSSRLSDARSDAHYDARNVGAAVTLTPATETDTAVALSLSKQMTLSPALETDGAQALGVSKRLTLPIATETDSALALTWKKALAPATEVDTALPVVPIKKVTLTPATETDSALSLGFSTGHSFTLAPALETDTAQSLSFRKVVPIAPAVESDQAQALSLTRMRTLAPATETDQALPLSIATGTRTLQPALETDQALPLDYFKVVTYAARSDKRYLISRTGFRVKRYVR